MARKLVVEIVGDATSLNRAFKQSSKSASTFGRSVTKTSSVSQRAFGGMARSIAGVSTALLGGAGLAFALRATFQEVQEAQKVAAQTNAVLKSTGGIAGVSAKDVDSLATSLSNLSGVDDELIASGENVLLTFTNVRNVMGKGNDVFDQATKAALDMSTALGTDLQGSVIRIGKALQDPIKGVTALRRVGVNFSKSQVAMIKALVESGRTLEAQKLILRELQVEFEGSAEAAGNTLAGKLGKLRESALNLSASLAATLLPVLTPIVDKLVEWLQNTENQEQVMRDFKGVVQALGSVLGGLRDVFSALNGITGSTRETVKLLLVAFVAYKTARIAATLAEIALQVGLIGRNAKGARGPVVGLGAALTGVGIGLAILQTETFKRIQKTAKEKLGPLSFLVSSITDQFKGFFGATEDLLLQLGLIEEKARAIQIPPGPRGPIVLPPAGARGPVGIRRGGAEAPGTTDPAQVQAQRDRLRQAREATRQEAQDRAAFAVERAAATEALADDLAALNRYNALLKKRIRGGHATLELEREQFQVQQQIADVLKQQAEKRAEQREARQFRALGLGPGGADLVPSADVLRKQLGSAEKALQGTFLDTKKTRSLVARIRKVLSGAMGAISEDVRSTIKRLIDDLKQMQEKASVDVTRFQKTARGQFALAGAAGGGRGVVITGGVHLHGIRNVQQLENELAKRHKRRARQRRSTR